LQKIIDYCKELDQLSNVDYLIKMNGDYILKDVEAQRNEYLIKITLATICDQNRKEGMAVTMSEKTAASDPTYLNQVNKALESNLAARIEKSNIDAIQTRIKSLHMLISAEKFLNGGQ